MPTRILQRQRGFTLIELLAVIAIMTVLAGIVAGAVTGIGASGQTARLRGDADTLGKAADRFFNDAFPQSYPVLTCCGANTGTSADITTDGGDLGVRLIDFEAKLPGDPLRSFVPDFVKEVPDTAGLVSWRVVTATGRVFFAEDGAQLILPSDARLDVSAVGAGGSALAASTVKSLQSDYTFKLRMNKNEATLQTLVIVIPAGYVTGGQNAIGASAMGTLTGKLSADNPYTPGVEVTGITGTLTATGATNEWKLFVDYPAQVDAVGVAASLRRVDRTYKVSIVEPSAEAPGAIKIDLTPRDANLATITGSGDKAHNRAAETWELTIYGKVNQTGANLITNPSVKGVYRWLATQHTSIDVTDLFNSVSGNQAVVIKES
jgi:prepilin-type N-terminal cleavage/methylation domain-containing protein